MSLSKVMKIEHNSIDTDLNETYYRLSFDCLCDDIVIEIFNYLPIKDKIRLECVSKQFQRCIIRGQTVLEISDNEKNPNNFADCLVATYSHQPTCILYEIKWENLIKVLTKFIYIRRTQVTKTKLIVDSFEKFIRILTALNLRILTIEFPFNYCDLPAKYLFGVKFGPMIREIKQICHHYQLDSNECNECNQIVSLFKTLIIKKCKINIIKRNWF